MELKNIKDNAKKYSIPIIRTESHKYLVDMIKKYQPKNILEIGTAVGYSGILMLENCNAFLTTIEHNKNFIKQANKNFKTARLSKRVKIVEGDCLVELAKMVASNNFNESFDFIFLDGPKAQYDGMLEMLLLLLKEGGVFIADNVTFRGYTTGEIKTPTRRYKTIIKRLNTFIENCKNHPNLTKFKLNLIEDGLIFAIKGKHEQ